MTFNHTACVPAADANANGANGTSYVSARPADTTASAGIHTTPDTNATVD